MRRAVTPGAVAGVDDGDPEGLLPVPVPPAETGARGLLLYMLADAIRCVSGRGLQRSKPAQKEARRWFEAQSLRPFGFGWVCQHLGLDPEGVRGAVLRAPSVTGSKVYHIARRQRTQMASRV